MGTAGGTETEETLASLRQHYIVRNLRAGLGRILGKKATLISFLYLSTIVFLGIVGPSVAPYDYSATLYGPDGEILRTQGASLAHPLGTTDLGQDVLSRVIVGARPTAITAVVGGGMIMTIGMTIGVVSGYVGGWVDEVLMRFTDMAFSVPLIPFAIVLLAFLGVGFFSSIIVIGLLLWRSTARVLRAQVLQIRERPFVKAAKASGASTPRIIIKHVIPNIAPMAFLFFAMGMGWAVILQAGLAFIGVSDPFVPSWGIIIRNAYGSGYVADQSLWALAPGLLISSTVLSAFLLGREFEADADRAIAGGAGE